MTTLKARIEDTLAQRDAAQAAGDFAQAEHLTLVAEALAAGAQGSAAAPGPTAPSELPSLGSPDYLEVLLANAPALMGMFTRRQDKAAAAMRADIHKAAADARPRSASLTLLRKSHTSIEVTLSWDGLVVFCAPVALSEEVHALVSVDFLLGVPELPDLDNPEPEADDE